MTRIVGIKIQLKQTILIFWTKFAHRGYFQSEMNKMNTNIGFCIFKLLYVSNFTFNTQFWIFWSNLPQKGIFSRKQKVKISIEFCKFELVKVPNFSLNRQFWFFGPNIFWTKRRFPASKDNNKINKNRHLSPHISIILCTKFQLKLTISFFWTKKCISKFNQI